MKAIHFFMSHPIVGKNQTKAAKMLNTKQQYVSYWNSESKKADMPIAMIPTAAEALGMKPSEFIAQVFEVEPEPTGG